MLIYHSENPKALKTYAKSTLPMLYKQKNEAWMTTYDILNIASPLLRPPAQKKIFLSKYDYSLTIHPATQELLWR